MRFRVSSFFVTMSNRSGWPLADIHARIIIFSLLRVSLTVFQKYCISPGQTTTKNKSKILLILKNSRSVPNATGSKESSSTKKKNLNKLLTDSTSSLWNHSKLLIYTDFFMITVRNPNFHFPDAVFPLFGIHNKTGRVFLPYDSKRRLPGVSQPPRGELLE